MTNAMRIMRDGRWQAALAALALIVAIAGPLAGVALAAGQPEAAAAAAAQAAATAAEQAAHAPAHRPGGEVNIQLPDLNTGDFLGMTGHNILLTGLVVCVLGLLFGAWTYSAVKNLPVHKSMADDLGAHLRDLQDLPDSAGQVPAHPRALHRHRHGGLLRADRRSRPTRSSSCCSSA